MIENTASSPSRMPPFIGTPMTGNGVDAAITPGRAAAMPAPAMITITPRCFAFLANSSTASGVRCADRALTSKGICWSLSHFMAFSITGRSLVEPIIILTFGVIVYILFVYYILMFTCQLVSLQLQNQEESTYKSYGKSCYYLLQAMLPKYHPRRSHDACRHYNY